MNKERCKHNSGKLYFGGVRGYKCLQCIKCGNIINNVSEDWLVRHDLDL